MKSSYCLSDTLEGIIMLLSDYNMLSPTSLFDVCMLHRLFQGIGQGRRYVHWLGVIWFKILYEICKSLLGGYQITVTSTSAKVLSTSFLCRGTRRVCGQQSAKVLLAKCFTLTNLRKFSPASFGKVTMNVTMPTCHTHEPFGWQILAKTLLWVGCP